LPASSLLEIDLDTIDVSNLNRQFLFRKRHVGQAKASVAAAAAAALARGARVDPARGDVRAHSPAFFRAFDLVVNGLDNLAARRHVNRACLAARVPLVETGTAGVLGQVTVHARGDAVGPAGADTACYECAPKAAPKAFPVCTIRSTPDKAVHCIVWAKDLLFARLLGPADAVTDLDGGEGGEGEGGDGGGDRAAAAALAFQRADGEAPAAYAARVFDRVFGDDVARVAGIEVGGARGDGVWGGALGALGACARPPTTLPASPQDLWTDRAPPTPLRLATLLPAGTAAAAAAAAAPDAGSRGVARALGLASDHAPWDAASAASVFVASLAAYHVGRQGEVGSSSFDKDDRLAAELVAAASALRGFSHAIPPMSLFDARGAAGNIVHAVASTNAVVAGLATAEALKLVARAGPSLRTTFLFAGAAGGKLLSAGAPDGPAAACAVCGGARLELALDCGGTTLADLVDKVHECGGGGGWGRALKHRAHPPPPPPQHPPPRATGAPTPGGAHARFRHLSVRRRCGAGGRRGGGLRGAAAESARRPPRRRPRRRRDPHRHRQRVRHHPHPRPAPCRAVGRGEGAGRV